MKAIKLAQPGVTTDPTPFVEYLVYVIDESKINEKSVTKAMGMISNVEKSISQKDTTSQFTITTAFSKKAWMKMFPNETVPENLVEFKDRKDGPRHMPSTPGDIFFMIKSTRIDLNFEAAKRLNYAFSEIATLEDDIQSFKYLDDRDMINFVDGTENPKGDERLNVVLLQDGPFKGGSFLTVQKYIHKARKWDDQTTETQEGAIGRYKFDDIEIPDDKKTPYAHNVKSKVHVDGVEKKMLRQNRPFGNAMQHGTMFVGFGEDPSIISTSLDQMCFADKDGNYDKLLDFVDAVTGTNYFVPPQSFLDTYS